MRRTDHTITAIAFNNGFPNVNALNTAIRRKYGMVPNEFRETLLKEAPAEAESEPYQVVEYDDVRTNLQILAGSDSTNAFGIYRYPDRIEYHVDDVTRFEPIRPIWRTMINAGKIRVLANAGFEAQLALAQEEIGFHYARLESVLTDESIPRMADGRYNFSNFDRAITLLQSQKLIPVLDLSHEVKFLILWAWAWSLPSSAGIRPRPWRRTSSWPRPSSPPSWTTPKRRVSRSPSRTAPCWPARA